MHVVPGLKYACADCPEESDELADRQSTRTTSSSQLMSGNDSKLTGFVRLQMHGYAPRRDLAR
jgi:hypothetical protein